MNASKTSNSISVTIPLTPAYSNKYVVMDQTEINLHIELTDGSHLFTSDLVNVGNLSYFHNSVLQAQITVWYNYDLQSNIITLCSSELISDDSTYLTTVPIGTLQYCRQHTFSEDNSQCGKNPNWNHCTPLVPGLQAALQQTVQEANNIIIEKAKELGFTVIVRTPLPKLTTEEYENFSAVYFNGKFLELYDPSKTYDSNHSITNIDSIWGGEIYLNNNEYFANVIGSTYDPKIAGLTWLQLWQNQFGYANDCSSRDYRGFQCSGGLVGGHVILGKTAKIVPPSVNYVFIMPICTAHNNNDNVYMAPLIYKSGIALHNYLGR